MLCKICGENKTLDEMVKDKRKPKGVRNICKQCENKRRRKTNKPVAKQGFKYCAKCKCELPLENFNNRNIGGKIKPFSYCKQCERELNNNKYKHTCKVCGKEYTSGKKHAEMCKTCYSKKFGERGALILREHNKNQYGENNYFYGSCRKGKENPNYNPLKTDEEREQGRIIEGYKEWRDEVFKRDNYTCQICGDNTGGNLNAHHLDGYSWCKEKRTDINNGVTLCDNCHKLFHSKYGFNDNTKEQFYHFKNNMLIPR